MDDAGMNLQTVANSGRSRTPRDTPRPRRALTPHYKRYNPRRNRSGKCDVADTAVRDSIADLRGIRSRGAGGGRARHRADRRRRAVGQSRAHRQHRIPGCAGKGIVDLVELYPRGRLEDTRQAMERSAFSRSGRAMNFRRPTDACRRDRVGRTDLPASCACRRRGLGGRQNRSTVFAMSCARTNAARRVPGKKRAILQSGTSDPAGYTHAKGEFINAVIGSSAA